MSLPSISLRRPILAIVMNIIIVIFGIVGFTFLGVRDYPAIDPPVINVRTSYTGANSDIMESQVTEPLEKAINGIAGIKSISSTSSQGPMSWQPTRRRPRPSARWRNAARRWRRSSPRS